MKIVDLGKVIYININDILEDYMLLAKNGEDYLLLCTHDPVYTIGCEKYRCNLPFIQTDRGGSITYFDEGTLMLYFACKVFTPAKFYAKALQAVERFFSNFPLEIYYDKKRPGFYIQNRKIASLGFRYKNGVSKHGVSLHISPNLENFNKIAPCGLEGIVATSLQNEGIELSIDKAKELAIKAVCNVFEA
ncbi:lipoyl(octanoyl) transferase [Nitratiruptor sp. YY08-26]|uniref:lipoyl protein ligase domain-containing protein n=1 Tax=unclassified Nitratiruptor TaxID=2624044 RepID=UPI001915DAEE|nr:MULTISPECIES: hypothetical protein [unclassified Nitratiruptor]BCD62276.1 lipoyl(octanoyl) transferase [Nitratiruptor sp. YY08-13]BCD66212.1 lipoyl(octanoyl) transferase [Nitratiruptor sp. YY08-26]